MQSDNPIIFVLEEYAAATLSLNVALHSVCCNASMI